MNIGVEKMRLANKLVKIAGVADLLTPEEMTHLIEKTKQEIELLKTNPEKYFKEKQNESEID